MKIRWIEIEGLRAYKNRVHLEFGNFTTLTGKNDAGKSTVFAALRMFLDSHKPDPGDYSVGGIDEIRVCLCFTSLPERVVIDSTVETTLEEEFLLDSSGGLTVEKRWQKGKTQPTVYAKSLQPIKDESKPLVAAKNGELKRIAKDEGVLDRVSDKRVNKQIRRAIWDKWTANHEATDEEEFVALDAEDGKQIATSLERYYPMFELFEADRQGTDSDQIAQDPAKLAVKAVLGRRTDQLAKLSQEIREEISDLLGRVVSKLAEIDPGLADSLSPIETEPNWEKAFSAVQFVDDVGVALNKHGSGTRRLVLLSFFHADIDRIDTVDSEKYDRGVVIAVEEPETALHPDLQREAIEVFREISEFAGRQVVITTHSSNLVRDLPIESVRYLEVGKNRERLWVAGDEKNPAVLLRKLSQSMGIFSHTSVSQFLYVEGKNDIESLRYLTDGIAAVYPDTIADIRKLEAAGELCFIPMGGCGAAELWENRLNPIRAKGWYLLDSDKDGPNAKLKPAAKKYLDWSKNSRSSSDFVHLLDRRELENYLTETAVVQAYADLGNFLKWFKYFQNGDEWNYLDIPRTCAKASLSCRNGADCTTSLSERAIKREEKDAKVLLSRVFSHESVVHNLMDGTGNDLSVALRQIFR